MMIPMAAAPRSSRQRYTEYRALLRQRRLARRAEKGKSPAEKAAPVLATTGKVRLGVERSRSRSRSFWILLGRFWGLLRGHRTITFLSLGALTMATLVGLLPVYGTKIVFDNVLHDPPLPVRIPTWVPVPENPYHLLTAVVIIMILLSFLAQALTVWSRWETTRAAKRVQVSVRKKVFDHAVRLPLHRVYDLKSGGVASILREDAGGVGDLLFSMIYNPWRAIVQVIGSLAILAWTDIRLLLGSLLLLPVVWFTHKTWISRIRPLFRDIRATRQDIDAHATESFGGMRVIRSFSRQRFESATFTNNNHLMARQELLAWWWTRGVDIAWSILIPTATALLLWYGGIRILQDAAQVKAGLMPQKDALTLGSLVMFMSYLAALLGPIATLANSATGLQNNLAGLDRVLDLLNEPIEMAPAADAISIRREAVRGRITLNHVSFSYPKSEKKASGSGVDRLGGEAHAPASANGTSNGQTPARDVLHEISLDVQPGEMIALVGPSGAGKTTLCNLVARFYDPTTGSIALDGIDLRQITVESYRRLLGIVEQDTFLFDGSIADNIAYGRRHASLDEIIHAAQLANAHEFIIQLEKGYDTLIGERGVKLSGGQRQRLTIARALLADPKILILDEATSNLDTESERLIQTSLQTLMAGRTSFVIAHRLSTIAHASRILVLEHGRVVEQGRHEELMAASGRYRTMVELQTHPPAPPTPHRAAPRFQESAP
jgi:ATP-binding cassette subfamily B protein/subfamily B ATP-binding cassette protein MsbA